MSRLAPIGISTYKRLGHLIQTVGALRRNTLASESDLYIFSDAPKVGDEKEVAAVRNFIKNVDGFKSVTVVERTFNDRIANNRSGMKQLIDEHEKLVFLEEDIVTAPGFLTYINKALDHYSDNSQVLSITGYCPPIKLPSNYNSDIFFMPRFCAWGLGMYRRTLDAINSPIDLDAFERVKKNSYLRFVGDDVLRMVEMEAKGELQAGDVRCMYFQLLNSMVTVYPTTSLVSNIGHDGSGQHCGKSNRFDVVLSAKTSFSFPNKLSINKKILKSNRNFRNNGGGVRVVLKNFFKGFDISTMNFNSKVKKILQWYYFRKQPKIVVASNGRAGSTMLFDSICESYVSNKLRFPPSNNLGKLIRRICGNYVCSLGEVKLSRCVVLKTHDLWSERFANDAKFIFVHGDPLEAALSAAQMTDEYGKSWFRQHQYNLRAEGDFSDLFEKDVLNYRKQLETWLSTKHKNVFPIAYEDLWNRQDEISRFVGFNVDLPQQRNRGKKTPPDLFNQLLFNKLREFRMQLVAE